MLPNLRAVKKSGSPRQTNARRALVGNEALTLSLKAAYASKKSTRNQAARASKTTPHDVEGDRTSPMTAERLLSKGASVDDATAIANKQAAELDIGSGTIDKAKT